MNEIELTEPKSFEYIVEQALLKYFCEFESAQEFYEKLEADFYTIIKCRLCKDLGSRFNEVLYNEQFDCFIEKFCNLFPKEKCNL